MVYYLLLFVLFFVIFGWLAWRILMKQMPATPPSNDDYECEVCNEAHCICKKKSDSEP